MKTTLLLTLLVTISIQSTRADISFQDYVKGLACDNTALKKTLLETFSGIPQKSIEGEEISTIGTTQILRVSCMVYPKNSVGDTHKMVRVDLDIAKSNFDENGDPIQAPLAVTSENKLISYRVSTPSSAGIVVDPHSGARRIAEQGAAANP